MVRLDDHVRVRIVDLDREDLAAVLNIFKSKMKKKLRNEDQQLLSVLDQLIKGEVPAKCIPSTPKISASQPAVALYQDSVNKIWGVCQKATMQLFHQAKLFDFKESQERADPDNDSAWASLSLDKKIKTYVAQTLKGMLENDNWESHNADVIFKAYQKHLKPAIIEVMTEKQRQIAKEANDKEKRKDRDAQQRVASTFADRTKVQSAILSGRGSETQGQKPKRHQMHSDAEENGEREDSRRRDSRKQKGPKKTQHRSDEGRLNVNAERRLARKKAKQTTLAKTETQATTKQRTESKRARSEGTTQCANNIAYCTH